MAEKVWGSGVHCAAGGQVGVAVAGKRCQGAVRYSNVNNYLQRLFSKQS